MRTVSPILSLLAAFGLAALHASFAAGGVNDPVAYWTFDNDFSDAMGAFDGTAVTGGGATVTIGSGSGEFVRGSGALKIDDPASGSQGFVALGQSPIADTQKQLSIAAWYKVADIAGDGSDDIKTLWSTSPNWSAEYSIRGSGSADGQWYFNGTDGAYYDTVGPVVADGLWHHVATVWDRNANRARYYHDGMLWDEHDTSGTTGDLIASTDFFIGDYRGGNGGRNFDGYVDDMAVFDRPLTDQEVRNLFHGATPASLDQPAVRAGRVLVDDSSSVVTVDHQSPGFSVNFQHFNYGDHELYSGHARLKQADGMIMANSSKNDDDNLVGVAGNLTFPTTDPRYENGMGFPTADLGTSTEENTHISFAHYPFAGGWIAGHVAADGTLLAGPNVPTGTTITKLDEGQAHVGPGNYVLSIAGVDSSTDGMLFVVPGENDDNYIGAGVFEDSSNVHVAAGDAALGDWHIHMRDNSQNDVSYDGENGAWSFLYLPYEQQPDGQIIQNLIGGRVSESGSLVGSVGDFTFDNASTGTYYLRIPDGQGGYLGGDDGILHLTASGILEGFDSGNNIDPVEAGAITWEFNAAEDRFEILAKDAPGSGLDNTAFVFAFVQYDNPLRLAVPEPTSLLLCCLGVSGLFAGRRRRRR